MECHSKSRNCSVTERSTAVENITHFRSFSFFLCKTFTDIKFYYGFNIKKGKAYDTRIILFKNFIILFNFIKAH